MKLPATPHRALRPLPRYGTHAHTRPVTTVHGPQALNPTVSSTLQLLHSTVAVGLLSLKASAACASYSMAQRESAMPAWGKKG